MTLVYQLYILTHKRYKKLILKGYVSLNRGAGCKILEKTRPFAA